MKLIRGLHNLRPEHRGCVATIGNFDGVHLGHQAILGQLAEKGAELRLPTVVIIFEPQPLEYFQEGDIPPRLSRLREKLRALRRYSIDRVLLIRFNWAFARMTAHRFIQQLLHESLGVRYLVVGDDFRFGARREGNFAMLTQNGALCGMEVVNMSTFAIHEERVSSTRIRQALMAGECQLAAQLLGRPYRISGRVAHGHQRGRTIGFPTANIDLRRAQSPLHGVFAVELYGLQHEPIAGIANLGNRPTVHGQQTLLEVYLFDFDKDIYGAHVDVDFLHRIRDEQKFPSFEALRQQIKQDVHQTRQWFHLHHYRI